MNNLIKPVLLNINSLLFTQDEFNLGELFNQPQNPLLINDQPQLPVININMAYNPPALGAPNAALTEADALRVFQDAFGQGGQNITQLV